MKLIGLSKKKIVIEKETSTNNKHLCCICDEISAIVSPVITLLALVALVTTSTLVYYGCFRRTNDVSAPSLPLQIQEAKKDLSRAKEEAFKDAETVKKRPRIESVVKVGTVLTTETLNTLQTREVFDLAVIEELQVTVEKAEKVINLQELQITQLEHKVFIWKVISGVIIVIAIIIVI